MSKRLRIGVDLDNTLIDYSKLFTSVGREMGVLPVEFEGDKQAVRDWLRQMEETGEQAWQRLQAEVYGRAILSAPMYEGALTFIEHSLSLGYEVMIISHKTPYAAQDLQKRFHLQKQAMKWIEQQLNVGCQGVFQWQKNVFFLETRAAKVSQISTCGCDIFIDDLLAVLQDAQFPQTTQKYWFSPANEYSELPKEIKRLSSWQAALSLL